MYLLTFFYVEKKGTFFWVMFLATGLFYGSGFSNDRTFFWSNNLTSFTPPHHQNTETPLEEQLNVLCLWMSLVKTSLNGMSHGTSVTQWSANN